MDPTKKSCYRKSHYGKSCYLRDYCIPFFYIGFFVTGGVDSDGFGNNHTEYFNGTNWIEASPLPFQSFGACLTQLNQTHTMHIGGTVDSYVSNSNTRTHFNVTNKVLVFDWTMEKWTELTSMSQSRWAAGCTTLPNGEILVAGGVSSLFCLNDGSSRNCNGNWLSNDALNTTEIFDPKTNSWKSGPALP